MESFQRMRNGGLPVSAETLRVQAEEIRTELLAQTDLTATERKRLMAFKVSRKYITGIIAWSGNKSVRLHGEAGSVDRAKIHGRMEEIREITSHYDPDFVFNEDETGVFYRLLPKRTYVLRGEKRTVRVSRA